MIHILDAADVYDDDLYDSIWLCILLFFPYVDWQRDILGCMFSMFSQVLLQSYAVTHLVICGRPHKDDHLANTELAVEQSGTTELHVAELVPDDPE